MTPLVLEERQAGSSLTVEWVEELLGTADDWTEPTGWHLDLSATRHVQPFASHRLAACLRSLALHDLCVTLPAKANRFRVLYRGGLAAAIAAHATEIRGEADRTIERLRNNPFRLEAGANVLLLNRVDDGSWDLNKDHFGARLWKAIEEHLGKVEDALDPETHRAVIEAGFEAVANVADHAYGKPFEGSETRTAYCLLSWERDAETRRADVLGVGAYREKVLEHLADQNEEFDLEQLGWFGMGIVDDGNGMAARHSLNREIYRGSIGVEEEALVDATADAATVKPRAGDARLRGDPGWGFSLMAKAVGAADGYIAIRTGRNLVEFDPFSVKSDWTLRPERLNVLRGTVLQILLPVVIPPDPKLQLDLFADDQ